MKARWMVVGVFALALAAGPALAIGLGDPAPPLQVKEWVKGKPVDLKEAKDKNVVVVEFWATWCGPCLASIPHMTELQGKFKDKGLICIGISSSDENLKVVKKFVEEMGDDMGYTVAYEDSGQAKTAEAYMKAFKVEGIPHAFVIDKKGNLVWMGHPRYGLEEVVAAVLGGESDVKQLGEIGKKAEEAVTKKDRMRQEKIQQYFELVSGAKVDKKAQEMGLKLFEVLKDDANIMNSVAWEILTGEEIKGRDLELALRMAKSANEVTKGKNAAILDTYARALWDNGKKTEAIAYQKKAVELCQDPKMAKELKEALKKYEQEAAGKKTDEDGQEEKPGKKSADDDADDDDDDDDDDDEGDEDEDEDGEEEDEDEEDDD